MVLWKQPLKNKTSAEIMQRFRDCEKNRRYLLGNIIKCLASVSPPGTADRIQPVPLAELSLQRF
jgi:hypothetical protein